MIGDDSCMPFYCACSQRGPDGQDHVATMDDGDVQDLLDWFDTYKASCHEEDMQVAAEQGVMHSEQDAFF